MNETYGGTGLGFLGHSTEGTLAGRLDLKEMPTEMMWGTLH